MKFAMPFLTSILGFAPLLNQIYRTFGVSGSALNRFRGNFIRSIGKARAALQIGLGNLLYNLLRLTFLEAKVS
jgi:hypothetical protein